MPLINNANQRLMPGANTGGLNMNAAAIGAGPGSGAAPPMQNSVVARGAPMLNTNAGVAGVGESPMIANGQPVMGGVR